MGTMASKGSSAKQPAHARHCPEHGTRALSSSPPNKGGGARGREASCDGGGDSVWGDTCTELTTCPLLCPLLEALPSTSPTVSVGQPQDGGTIIIPILQMGEAIPGGLIKLLSWPLAQLVGGRAAMSSGDVWLHSPDAGPQLENPGCSVMLPDSNPSRVTGGHEPRRPDPTALAVAASSLPCKRLNLLAPTPTAAAPEIASPSSSFSPHSRPPTSPLAGGAP